MFSNKSVHRPLTKSSEETDFDQSRFGHPDLANLGQSIIGQSIIANPFGFGCVSWPQRVGPKPRKNWAPKDGGNERWGPEGWGHEGWGPEISRFFPSPAPIFVLFVSLGVLSWFFGGVWKRRGRQMFTLGVLGLWCEAPAAPKPPWFHMTTREPKRAHLRVLVFTNTTKIQREDTQ